MCGIVDWCDKEYDMILPADIVSDLQQIPAVSVLFAGCVSTNDAANVSVDVSSEQVLSESGDTSSLLSNDDVTNAEFVNHSSQSCETMNDDSSRLMHEQQQDETRSDCWNMARQSKGNFVISRGLLYRKDNVEGQPVCQLCVPVARRDVILKLGDCSGPLEPPSAQGHKYCLHICVLLLCCVMWCLCVMAGFAVEVGMMLLYDIVADESVMPSVRVEPVKVQQRDESQRSESLEVSAFFPDKPGLCVVVAHRVVATPEFTPKQMKPHSVPVALRSEGNRRISWRRKEDRWLTELHRRRQVADLSRHVYLDVVMSRFSDHCLVFD